MTFNSRLDYRYQADINKVYAVLTEAEEIHYVKLAKAGDNKAKEILLNSQLKQIVKMARGFVTEESSLSELFGEAVLGFYRGIEEFDPGKGFRLVTYAHHWVKAFISAYAHGNDMIRHPNNVQLDIKRAEKARKRIQKAELDGENPAKEDLLLVADCDKSFPIRYNVRSFGEEVRQGSGKLESEATLEDMIGEDDGDIETVQHMVGVKKVLSRLSEDEREIFVLYFGLEGNDRHTVEEIAKIMGPRYKDGTVTKQYISLIKVKAIKKLHRHFKVDARLFESEDD